KRRARGWSGAWEPTSREAYTGAIGYVSPCRGMELNVAIRTFETDGASIWLGAGGGIVAGSDAQAELDECWAKAGPLIEAIGGRLPADAQPHRTVGPDAGSAHARAQHATRSHPGIFETLRVEGGHPLDLDAHLFRLDASVRAVFGANTAIGWAGATRLPVDTRERILDAAYATSGVYRMRVDATLVDGRVQLSITTHPIDAERQTGSDGRARDPGQWVLVPRVIGSGHGPHKWADRTRLEPSPPDGHELLLLDTDRTVLEGGRSSLFMVDANGLHTPP